MGKLEVLFPCIQFIVTTHSPLIVQGSESVNVVLLKRSETGVEVITEKSTVSNWRVDQILTSELFSLPSLKPSRIANLERRRASIMRKAHLTEEDKQEVERIGRQLESLPLFDNPDDEEALALLRRAAESFREMGIDAED